MQPNETSLSLLHLQEHKPQSSFHTECLRPLQSRTSIFVRMISFVRMHVVRNAIKTHLRSAQRNALIQFLKLPRDHNSCAS